jgi:hypothetical protein
MGLTKTLYAAYAVLGVQGEFLHNARVDTPIHNSKRLFKFYLTL